MINLTSIATLTLLATIAASCGGGNKKNSITALAKAQEEKEAAAAAGTDTPVSDDKQFAAFQNGNNCVDPDLKKIPSSVMLTLCDGSLVKGTAVEVAETSTESSAPLCTTSGEINCLTSTKYRSVEQDAIDPSKIASGFVLNGVTGTYLGAGTDQPDSCTASNQEGCLTTSAIKSVATADISASNLLTGFSLNGVSGTATPSPSDCSASNEEGCVTTSSIKSVATADIAAGNLLTGFSLNGVSGTATPSPSDCSASNEEGCVTTSSIKSVATADITAGNLLTGFSLNGVSGTATPAPSDCSASNVVGCVTTAGFKSIEQSSLNGSLQIVGYDLNGVTGTAAASGAADCSSTGELGCISVAAFPAIDAADVPELFLKTDILVHWDFDETSDGSGSVLRDDASSNGYDLSDTNLVPSVAALLGLGADLTNGDTEFFEIAATNFDMTANDFSISFWFNRNSGTGYQTIASHWDDDNDSAGWFFGMVGDTLDFHFTTDGAPSGSNRIELTSGALSSSTWYHAVATYDYSTGSSVLYVDGVQVASNSSVAPNTSIFYDATVPVRIGRLFDDSFEFNGSVDEFSIWKGRVLNAKGVQRLYNSGTPLSYSNF